MLTYKCPTCDTEFEAQYSGAPVIYVDGNKRVTLKNDSDDCYKCETEIKEAQEKARQELRAKKKNTNTL